LTVFGFVREECEKTLRTTGLADEQPLRFQAQVFCVKQTRASTMPSKSTSWIPEKTPWYRQPILWPGA